MTHRDSTVSEATAADVDRHHQAYSEAMASVRHAIAQFDGCSEAEKSALAKELADLEAISLKQIRQILNFLIYARRLPQS